MEKVKLALNYALMLEMMKAKEVSDSTVAELLDEGNEELLESFGEGIPSWKTLVDYYKKNKDKFHQAIKDGYEIGFLTKGALKSLLSIKFGLKEGVDFVDTGEFLKDVNITDIHLLALQDIISKNWTIVPKHENIEKALQIIDIELTYKPHF
jgi:hypothetical protein